MDLLRRADVVPRAFNRQIDVSREADADAGIDLRPVPPDARRRILRAVSFETVVQFAPADGRLDAQQRTGRDVEFVSELPLRTAAMHAGDALAGELNGRSQALPLRVDAGARLFFFLATDRKTFVERPFEQVEVDAVKRAGQRRVFVVAKIAAVVERNGV